MQHRPLLLGLLFTTACSSGISPGDVKAALTSPTGSISDNKTMVGASTEGPLGQNALSASGASGLRLGLHEAGGAVELKGDGLGYKRQLFDTFAARVRGVQRSALSSTSDDGCAQAYTNAMNQAALQSPTSGSFSASLDFSACPSAGISGKLHLSASYSMNILAQTGTIHVEETFDNVCVAKSCVNGVVRADEQVGASGISITTAWDLDVTQDSTNLHVRGGVEMSMMGETTKIREVAFVKDGKGNEVSLVFTAKSDSSGFEITGKDGTTTCTWAADHSGSCSNGLNWTAAEGEAHLAEDSTKG
ncbi:MAG: hypothetical protein U1E65_15455 [Myxococcota bacterium]